MRRILILLTDMSALITSHAVFGQTIDVHSHNILPEYMAVLERHVAEMEETFLRSRLHGYLKPLSSLHEASFIGV